MSLSWHRVFLFVRMRRRWREVFKVYGDQDEDGSGAVENEALVFPQAVA